MAAGQILRFAQNDINAEFKGFETASCVRRDVDVDVGRGVSRVGAALVGYRHFGLAGEFIDHELEYSAQHERPRLRVYPIEPRRHDGV